VATPIAYKTGFNPIKNKKSIIQHIAKMKNILLILTILLLTVFMAVAQAPDMFKYQTVIRNGSNEILKNQNVALRISILQESETGTIVYRETHKKTTNDFGLINLEIGSGTVVSGAMNTIDWSTGTFFVKVELDANNGNNFTSMGTSQLLSVPYSLYSEKSGDGFSGSFNDLIDKPILVSVTKTPVAGDILFYNGTGWELLPKGTNGNMLRLDNGLPNWGEPGYALPVVTTVPVTDIMTNSAKSGGNIISTGFTTLTASGVCWATTQNPTTTNSKTTDGIVTGTFTSNITDLQPNTTYYVRAYATNSAGTTYGNQINFRTFQTVVFPTVTTSATSNVTKDAATGGGNVTATGGAEVTARGVCWSKTQNPTVADNKTTEGTGTGQFVCPITGLEYGTTYYVRAFATNSAGTGYGSQGSFTTEKTLPVVTTKNVTDVSSMGGITGGTIVSTGGGTISERGIVWGESPNPTILDTKETTTTTQASFSCAIIKATKPNTTYYVRAYAKNELGVAYGEQKSFTTGDAQYHTSFENGMTPVGWTGPWTVKNEDAFDGSYSFKSLVTQDSETSKSFSLAESGYLIFYFRLINPYSSCEIRLELYVDNVIKETYKGDNTGWKQGLIELSSGNHTVTFKVVSTYCNNGNLCYIDHITITK
jgi:hypothetical protein